MGRYSKKREILRERELAGLERLSEKARAAVIDSRRYLSAESIIRGLKRVIEKADVTGFRYIEENGKKIGCKIEFGSQTTFRLEYSAKYKKVQISNVWQSSYMSKEELNELGISLKYLIDLAKAARDRRGGQAA